MERAGTDQGGWSLAELLVVVAVLGLVMAGLFMLLVSTIQSYAYGAARVEAQQAARFGLDRMARELREAGFDPKGAGFPAIAVAEPTRVVLQHDLNGNGVIDPTRDRVTYLLRDSVLRRDAGGGAQPLVEGVRSLRLTYYDRAGVETTRAAHVTSVRIRLEVGEGGAAVVLESLTTLRNLW